MSNVVIGRHLRGTSAYSREGGSVRLDDALSKIPLGVRLEIASAIVAGALWLFPPTPEWLDDAYTGGFYPALQHAMTRLTNALPFALGDVLFVAVALTVLVVWFRALRRPLSSQKAGRALLRTISLASCLYIWFTIFWGWNYERPALYHALEYDAASVERIDNRALEENFLRALNAAALPAHAAHGAAPERTPALRAAYERTLEEVRVRVLAEETVPKRTLLDPYFTATGISGMFFPFTFETYLASDLLWYEHPFDLEHEWGHVAGIARESDANFVGAIATLESPDPVMRYSGLLMVYAAMPRIKELDLRLSSLVAADYNAIHARNEHHIKPIAFKFAWGTYDKYLKSQHVTTGVVNYTEYVRLLLGTPLGRRALATATGRAVPTLATPRRS
jgi:hypothetical protein